MAGLRVIIMCKAPVPGKVKTRLMQAYSADEACRLHAAMARTVIHRAAHLFDAVSIAADDPTHAFFREFGLPVLPQGQGDLGQRMQRLAGASFRRAPGPVLFLGTDSPHMKPERLQQAGQALKSHDVVLGPVEDGGYDLMALNADWPVFSDIAWSGPAVLEQTLNHCRRLELRVQCLEISFDVDTPQDLQRAVAAGWSMPR